MKNHQKPNILLLLATAFFILTACHKQNQPAPMPPPALPPPSLPPLIPPAAWTQLKTLPAEKITALETSGDNIYAASGTGKVYVSTNNGASWYAVHLGANVQITSLIAYNNNMYAGTMDHGIFVSDNKGATWKNQNTTIQQVSSFTIWNNKLYCSSSVFNNNVFSLNADNSTWSLFTQAGFPVNIAPDTRKLVTTDKTIFALRGGDNFCFTYNTTSKQWDAVFFPVNAGGLNVNDMIYNNGVLLAAKKDIVFSSNNAGVSWVLDTLKLNKDRRSSKKILMQGSNSIYVVTSLPPGDIWIQQRNNTLPIGSGWANGQQILKIGAGASANAIHELNGTLFLGTDKGLYFKKV